MRGFFMGDYMKSLFAEIAGKHSGKPIIVMGGGESLPDDLKRVPSDAIRISCNHHAIKKHRADYVCAVDDNIAGDPLDAIIRRYSDAPIISVQSFADYRIEAPKPHVINTGIFSVYIASLLGGWPVICAGMDFYQSSGYAYSDGKIKDRNKTSGYLQNCIKRMQELTDNAPVRSSSGLLTDYFGAYESGELMPDYTERRKTKELKTIKLSLIEWLKDKRVKGNAPTIGEKQIISARDAKYLASIGLVKILQML